MDKEAAVKRDRGQPRAFATEQDFKDKFAEYILYCIEKKRFPNIAGFCVFADIVRDTYYAQQEYYSDAYKMTRDMLEDEVLQDNTYRMQLYLKNTFGYTDKVQTENVNVNMEAELTEEEADKIIKKFKR